jgi:hypothetical protein
VSLTGDLSLLLLPLAANGVFVPVLSDGTMTPEEDVVELLKEEDGTVVLRRGVPDILGVGFGIASWPETFQEASV